MSLMGAYLVLEDLHVSLLSRIKVDNGKTDTTGRAGAGGARAGAALGAGFARARGFRYPGQLGDAFAAVVQSLGVARS